ncbi:MAG: hypothetical protein ACI8Y4_001058, partial [Candidatus Poriferisodalaceae bacterium]
DEEVAVLVEGFLSTFCSYFCECVEMADGCFTRRVVRPASSAVMAPRRRSHPVRLVAPSAVNEALSATSTRDRRRSIRDRSEPASKPRAVSLDASASSRSNPAPFVMTQTYGGGGTANGPQVRQPSSADREPRPMSPNEETTMPPFGRRRVGQSFSSGRRMRPLKRLAKPAAASFTPAPRMLPATC